MKGLFSMGALGAVGGAVVSALAQFPVWGWFVLTLSGIAASLFITNEWAEARIRGRASNHPATTVNAEREVVC